jgi:hypothetical protein
VQTIYRHAVARDDATLRVEVDSQAQGVRPEPARGQRGLYQRIRVADHARVRPGAIHHAVDQPGTRACGAARAPLHFDGVIERAQRFEPPGVHLEHAEAFESTHGGQRADGHAMSMHVPVGAQVPQESGALAFGQLLPQGGQSGTQPREQFAPITAGRGDGVRHASRDPRELAHRSAR